MTNRPTGKVRMPAADSGRSREFLREGSKPYGFDFAITWRRLDYMQQ